MRFRKKPVVINAWQFTNLETPTPEWLNDAFKIGAAWYQGGDDPYMTIKTLEGDMHANPGDWIIQGVKGELYPCKQDIFEATYEEVGWPE